MTRIAPYLALALLGLTGCSTDSVREASAQTLASTLRSGSDMRPASGSQQAYELRRVWSGTDFNFYWNEPSPDGHYVSEIDWGTGNLAMIDLTTGDMVRVTEKREYPGFAYGSVFSPDGKQLAYRWFTMGDEDEYDLRIIGVDGSNERILIDKRPGIRSILPTDWSPDGRHLLAAVERPDNTVQLALIAVADGSMQVLKSLGWHWPAEALLSPDGRYVAYSMDQASSAANADPPDLLRILAVDGSQEVTVAPHEGPQRMLGWTPDGGAVLFYRHEGISGSIWRVAIQAGRQVGEPILIETDVQVSSIGFSQAAYFFGTQVESQQVHTATVDPDKGGFVVDPRPVQDPASVRTSSASWSPDGRQLAYVKQSVRSAILVVRAADGGEQREISTDLTGLRDVVWASDGESVMVLGLGKGKHNVGPAIYGVDLASGNIVLLVRDANGTGNFAAAPDGQSLYISRLRDGIVRHDLSTGQETLLHRSNFNWLVAVSRDGSRLAVVVADNLEEHILLILSTDDGGEVRELYRTQAPEGLDRGTGLAWAPDGRAVLFLRHTEPGARILSRISAEGGSPQDIAKFGCTMPVPRCPGLRLRVHPDGRRIAFDWGSPKGEIWMMTGFGVGDAVSGTSQGR